MKKKISWITPDYYIDVDLPIVDRLSQIFTIKWMIVISRNASRIKKQYTIFYGEFRYCLILHFDKKTTSSFLPNDL